MVHLRIELITSCWNRRHGWNVRTSERKSTKLSENSRSRDRNDSRHARSRPRERKRKKRWSHDVVKSACKVQMFWETTKGNVGSVRLAVSFIFIAPFRSLDSTLFLAVFLFLCLLYLIISRRCAIVPQFVYLVAYLVACLFALLQPAEPIYTNVRESSTEN